MAQTSAAVVELLNQFVAWAEHNPDVRAALLIGSRARQDHPADQWSDIDLIVTITDPQPYIDRGDWLHQIGRVWATHVETTIAGVTERRVLFDGGFDFDLILVTEQALSRLVQNDLVARVIRRGIRVLVDKDRIMSRITLPIGSRATYQPPTQAEFLNLVSSFWFHAAWTAKKLRRGEVWTALMSCDGSMKWLLMRMLEWHTRTVGTENYDTWFDGRFVEEWADRRALAALTGSFAHYNAADIRRALLESMDLFRWLAQETAAQLTYPYPTQSDEDVTRWVETTLADLH